MYRSEAVIIDFRELGDARGKLVSLEAMKSIPMVVSRVYYIYGVCSDKDRGFHAHRNLKQLLIALQGKITVKCEYKGKEEVFLLDSPSKGLLLDSCVWHSMSFEDASCILMVLADGYYDESDYIRDYEEFKRLDAESLT